jgi:hypothetical protein
VKIDSSPGQTTDCRVTYGWLPDCIALFGARPRGLGFALDCINTYKGGLFGKRSASGRRQQPGSGGQATDPAGAIHRLALWVGGLSTAGVMGTLK